MSLFFSKSHEDPQPRRAKHPLHKTIDRLRHIRLQAGHMIHDAEEELGRRDTWDHAFEERVHDLLHGEHIDSEPGNPTP